MTQVEFLRQDWTRVTLTLPTGESHRGVTIHYDGTAARAISQNGEEIGVLDAPTIWRHDAKTFDLRTDATTWAVYVAGCNCGG